MSNTFHATPYNLDAALFKACGINQSNLNTWLDKIDEPTIAEGYLKEAATELFYDCYLHSIPESIRYYVDYDSFARDCELGGDLTEFDFNNSTYTCTNASGV